MISHIHLSIKSFTEIRDCVELSYQFILSSKHSPNINLRLFSLNFCSIPSTPHFFLFLPWWLLLKTVTWHHFCSVFIYIYSLLNEKDPHEGQKVSVKSPCLFVPFFSGKGFCFLLLFSCRLILFKC